jgi:nickel-dependent lactate racemase
LILAAECAEGLGSGEFSRMATSYSSPGKFRERILSNPVVIDQWQLEECVKAATHAEVILVAGGIESADRERLFVATAESVEEALDRGLRKHGKNAAVAVIPKGPYTLVGIEH